MIILRDVRHMPNRPPCECTTLYSVDHGATWMSQREYFRWHTNFFTIVNLHDAHKVTTDT